MDATFIKRENTILIKQITNKKTNIVTINSFDGLIVGKQFKSEMELTQIRDSMIRNQMYFGISFEMIYNFLVLGELLIKIAITKYITLEIHNEILFERSNESDVNCITINVPVDEKRYTINSDKIAMYICAKFSFK